MFAWDKGILTESMTLILFAATLLGCILLHVPILIALIIGYFIFCIYGLGKQHTLSQLLRMSATGIYTVKNILLTFLLIGMLTALWRASGTIPVIIVYAANLISPGVFIVMAFLLNCLVSVLTGTAFGTAATIGVICMTMARTMGIPPVLAGGAILSGAFFGDRCSPVSTSALLISELTGTNLFQNIKGMIRTALVPFLASCAIYIAMGFAVPGQQDSGMEVQALFAGNFRLHWVLLLPAAAILILSALKINVKVSMLASIVTAAILCLLLQRLELSQMLSLLIFGYRSPNEQIAAMLNGGGIVSMVNVAAIVCLSSSYAGIFEGTGLLTSLKSRIEAFSQKTSAYGSILCTSIVAAMIACNQTLAIMLTHQLCKDLEKDGRQMALDLENSAVVVSPLIPWSIACAVPLAAVSAPVTCVFAACYLYLLPLWRLFRQNKKTGKNACSAPE